MLIFGEVCFCDRDPLMIDAIIKLHEPKTLKHSLMSLGQLCHFLLMPVEESGINAFLLVRFDSGCDLLQPTHSKLGDDICYGVGMICLRNKLHTIMLAKPKTNLKIVHGGSFSTEFVQQKPHHNLTNYNTIQAFLHRQTT